MAATTLADLTTPSTTFFRRRVYTKDRKRYPIKPGRVAKRPLSIPSEVGELGLVGLRCTMGSVGQRPTGETEAGPEGEGRKGAADGIKFIF